ncbi:MAG: 30S ribosomal protein S17e [Candidatus Woesearchaeota archaeon]
MGRIKTKLVKRFTEEIFAEHAADFKKDFNENKPLVEKYLDVNSRKLRNVIAGYITRLVRARRT